MYIDVCICWRVLGLTNRLAVLGSIFCFRTYGSKEKRMLLKGGKSSF